MNWLKDKLKAEKSQDLRLYNDYPPIPLGASDEYCEHVARERLDEAVDFFLNKYSISEEDIERPRCEYKLTGYWLRCGSYDSELNRVNVDKRGLGMRQFFGEETGHWLYHAVNPDETINSFTYKDKSVDGWLALCNLHELMGRYAANIFSGGKPAKTIDLTNMNHSHYGTEHRWGYEWADAIWREHGDAYFDKLLLATLEEAVALLDQLGFEWEDIREE